MNLCEIASGTREGVITQGNELIKRGYEPIGSPTIHNLIPSEIMFHMRVVDTSCRDQLVWGFVLKDEEKYKKWERAKKKKDVKQKKEYEAVQKRYDEWQDAKQARAVRFVGKRVKVKRSRSNPWGTITGTYSEHDGTVICTVALDNNKGYVRNVREGKLSGAKFPDKLEKPKEV
jgi:hypothetical protein